MRIACTDQDSAEWFTARCAKVTASRMRAAMRKMERGWGDKKKGDWHGDHDTLVREIAREMLTGIPAWHRVTPEMDYGKAWEPEARRAYSEATGRKVATTGLVLHPTLDFIGSSPDGLCDDFGLECKVPLLSTHMDTMFNDAIPEQYIPQMQCAMLCTGLPEWEFMSFCPKDPDDDERYALPDELRIFTKRLSADKELFGAMEEAATRTIEEAIALVEKLKCKIKPENSGIMAGKRC